MASDVRLLSAIHRWSGAFIGLLLALLGLTGAILVWEGEWVSVPGAGDPVIEDVGAMTMIAERAAARGELSRITFASDEIGLHQASYADGSGAYIRQDGVVADQWASLWERPELWLFDLHHHLFAGDTGETVTGIAGMAGLLFVITGAILWWRSRRSFGFRLWPRRMAPGPIVSQHRDLGIVAAPLLLLSFVTGVLMIFDPLRHAIVGDEVRSKVDMAVAAPSGATPIGSALQLSSRRFPDAPLRRISFPSKPGDPIAVRMKQPSEWTPNGRTQLTFDARTGEPLSIEDPLAGNRAAFLSEKLYPLHSAKVGGVLMKVAMTASGLALALLGSLATYSFWARRSGRRTGRRAARARAPGQSRPAPAGRG